MLYYRHMEAPDETYYRRLHELLSKPRTAHALFEMVVLAPFHQKIVSAYLGLGVVILLLVDEPHDTINSVAVSKTDAAKDTAVHLPLGHHRNAIVKAVVERAPQQITDWSLAFAPELTTQEARMNQAETGTECSVIFPIIRNNRVRGALLFGYLEPPEQIGTNQYDFMTRYSQLVADHLGDRTAPAA
jgi:hypothetical protein